MYLYFDKVAVSAFATPASTEFSGDATIVEGSPLITNGYGKCEGTFRIPDPRVQGNPKFKTGEVEIRLTSNKQNNPIRHPLLVVLQHIMRRGCLKHSKKLLFLHEMLLCMV